MITDFYKIDENYHAQSNLDGKLVSFYLNTDPVTGVAELSLYTDDGKGNGELITCLRLADVLRCEIEYRKERDL